MIEQKQEVIIVANVNYDYLENVKEDVRDYIDNEIDFTDYESMDDLEQDLNDKLFIEDKLVDVLVVKLVIAVL